MDPYKATGRPCHLWVEYAKFHERRNELEKARAVFERGVRAKYKEVNDLATVWCDYAEFEIRHKFRNVVMFFAISFIQISM